MVTSKSRTFDGKRYSRIHVAGSESDASFTASQYKAAGYLVRVIPTRVDKEKAFAVYARFEH